MALLKQMEKYRDVDEDELLKKLSEEELERLEDELQELDPDVSLMTSSPKSILEQRVLLSCAFSPSLTYLFHVFSPCLTYLFHVFGCILGKDIACGWCHSP